MTDRVVFGGSGANFRAVVSKPGISAATAPFPDRLLSIDVALPFAAYIQGTIADAAFTVYDTSDGRYWSSATIYFGRTFIVIPTVQLMARGYGSSSWNGAPAFQGSTSAIWTVTTGRFGWEYSVDATSLTVYRYDRASSRTMSDIRYMVIWSPN